MRSRLSLPLCFTSVALFVLGVGLGFLSYLGDDRSTPTHQPDHNAWPVHLALTAVALAALAFAGWRWKSGRGSGLFLLTPIGSPAAARLRQTARSAPFRLIAIAPLLLIMAYLVVRCGMQVTIGLNDASTVNAWGGPTYVGAMYAHYLDAAIIIALGAGLIHKVMLPVGSSQSTDRASQPV